MKKGSQPPSLPRSTPTEAVLELAAKAWLRANDACDRVIQNQLGTIVWEQHDWRRASIRRMLRYARYGDRCAITGLRFDITGRPHHPCAPTLVAHRDHAARFLDGTQGLKLASLTDEDLRGLAGSNAVVQTWLLNKLIASDHISWILATIQHSRPGCAKLARSLVAGSLLDLSPSGIDSLTQRPPLAPDGVSNTELVACNDELHSFVDAANIQGVIDSHPPQYKKLNGLGVAPRRSSSNTICVRQIVCNTATLATMLEFWC